MSRRSWGGRSLNSLCPTRTSTGTHWRYAVFADDSVMAAPLGASRYGSSGDWGFLTGVPSTQVEEYALITKAKPADQKSSSLWEGNLRGGGTQYVLIGNIFSQLYAEVKPEEERPLPKDVSSPCALCVVMVVAAGCGSCALRSVCFLCLGRRYA